MKWCSIGALFSTLIFASLNEPIKPVKFGQRSSNVERSKQPARHRVRAGFLFRVYFIHDLTYARRRRLRHFDGVMLRPKENAMRFYSFLLIVVLVANSGLVFADGHSSAQHEKTKSLSALSYEGGTIAAKDPRAVWRQLSKGLQYVGDADVIKIHVIAIRDGRAIQQHTSKTFALRKRPGRTKASLAEGLPEAGFFEGLMVKDFISPKSDIQISGEENVAETAEHIFKASGHTDGIFVVATFDNMTKEDAPRGLVGFGSWN